MSESKIKEDGSGFASLMSAAFAGLLATLTFNGVEINDSLFIGPFDVVEILVSFIIFSILLYPFNRFFGWLYSASPNTKNHR